MSQPSESNGHPPARLWSPLEAPGYRTQRLLGGVFIDGWHVRHGKTACGGIREAAFLARRLLRKRLYGAVQCYSGQLA